MRKILGLFLVCICLNYLTGCGNNAKENQDDKTLENSTQNIIEENLLAKGFKCSALNDNTIVDIKPESHIILLNNGEVYKYVLGDELYSNDEQCKKFSDTLIKRINRGYYLGNDNNVYTITNDKFEKYDIKELQTVDRILLFDDDLVQYDYAKMMEEDGYPVNEFGYTKNYVLKKDGKIYYRFYKYNDSYAWSSTTFLKDTLWEKSEQFGHILSFKRDNSDAVSINIVISDKGLYYLKDIETEECLKYADVECEKDYVKSKLYDEYKNQIKFINGEYTIFKNNDIMQTRIFVDNDKEK